MLFWPQSFSLLLRNGLCFLASPSYALRFRRLGQVFYPQSSMGTRANWRQGAYHFVYIIAPERTKDVAAFLTGLFNILAWWFTACSGNIFVGISAFGIVSLWHENFSATQWQVYLWFLGTLVLSREC